MSNEDSYALRRYWLDEGNSLWIEEADGRWFCPVDYHKTNHTVWGEMTELVPLVEEDEPAAEPGDGIPGPITIPYTPPSTGTFGSGSAINIPNSNQFIMNPVATAEAVANVVNRDMAMRKAVNLEGSLSPEVLDLVSGGMIRNVSVA